MNIKEFIESVKASAGISGKDYDDELVNRVTSNIDIQTEIIV